MIEPEPLLSSGLTEPETELLQTGGAPPKGSNPDFTQHNIPKTAAAKCPDLTDPKLNLQGWALPFNLHGAHGATQHPLNA
ncbi:hypothetical protein [Roseiflexus castenholzii]|uniref:hypothetical protein n=1 Tax=Roseiflexus castenholzii TaxID=120962 RepID=UPI0012EE8D9F|nr:hypothetical protein [Roseiflexus castenholzii]